MSVSELSEIQASGAQTERRRVSVVIASVTNPSYLEKTLAALGQQQGGVSAEIVVADRLGAATSNLVAQKFPWVRLIRCDQHTSVPLLRAAGISESRGDIVTTLDDHCIPAPDWLDRIVEAHRLPYLAIGGLIENGATERLVDWAVFLCEYSAHYGPRAPGPTDDLPGPNVSYKREALQHFDDLLAAGQWEMALHQRLRERGFELYREPAIVVYHRQFFTAAQFVVQRFHYGRSFAGARVQGAPLSSRALLALSTPLLPGLLLWRIARRVLPRRRHRLLLLKALPLLALFQVSSALGELIGYLTGPGHSLEQVA